MARYEVSITSLSLGRKFEFCDFQLDEGEQDWLAVELYRCMSGYTVHIYADHVLAVVSDDRFDREVICALGRTLAAESVEGKLA
ncbi:MAG TPA: hypothetical protein VD907_03120 [Verrucomicrobiae bacterium]|nr:hypothetical protein [Verrucomicrobiae bacterium]